MNKLQNLPIHTQEHLLGVSDTEVKLNIQM